MISKAGIKEMKASALKSMCENLVRGVWGKEQRGAAQEHARVHEYLSAAGDAGQLSSSRRVLCLMRLFAQSYL